MTFLSSLRHAACVGAFLLWLCLCATYAHAATTFNLTATGSASGVSSYNSAILGTQDVEQGSNFFSLYSHSSSSSRFNEFHFTLSNSHPLQQGDVFTVGGSAPSSSVSETNRRRAGGGENPLPTIWSGTGGQITIIDLSATSITLRFDGVVLASSSGDTLALNGTITTDTANPTATPAPTATQNPGPTATATPTPTATATPAPTATVTPEPTSTPSPKATPLPTATATPKPTAIPNRAPVIANVVLTPTAPKTGAQLTVRVSVTDADKDALTYTYAWTRTRGGKSIIVRTETSSISSDTLATKEALAISGDVVTVTVTASDGQATSALMSAKVTMTNTPVVLSKVTLVPTSPKTRDVLTASVVVQDADGTVPRLTYVWSKTSGATTTTLATVTSTKTQTSLDLSRAGNGNKGDTISLTVTASDGASSATKSASVKVVNTVPALANLKLAPTSPKTTGKVTASFTTTDPDASDKVDTLIYTYSCKVGSKALSSEKTNTVDLSKYAFIKAGDSVTLTVRVGDGAALSAAQSATVTVASAPRTKNSAGSS